MPSWPCQGSRMSKNAHLVRSSKNGLEKWLPFLKSDFERVLLSRSVSVGCRPTADCLHTDVVLRGRRCISADCGRTASADRCGSPGRARAAHLRQSGLHRIVAAPLVGNPKKGGETYCEFVLIILQTCLNMSQSCPNHIAKLS